MDGRPGTIHHDLQHTLRNRLSCCREKNHRSSKIKQPNFKRDREDKLPIYLHLNNCFSAPLLGFSVFSYFCPFPIVFIIFYKNKIYHLRVGIGIHHWWEIDIGLLWLEGPLHDHTLQWVNNVQISSSCLANETFCPNSLLEKRERE